MGLAIRRRGFVAGALAFPAAAAAGTPGTVRGPREEAWENAILVWPDGSRGTLQRFRAPVALLVLWASWCPNCLAEMASLRALADTLGQTDLDVALVGHPADARRNARFAQSHRLPLTSLEFDPGTPSALVADAFGARSPNSYAVPQSLAFAGRGRTLAWTAIGDVRWTDDGQAERLRRLASEARRGAPFSG